jgi:hypothetical protein
VRYCPSAVLAGRPHWPLAPGPEPPSWRSPAVYRGASRDIFTSAPSSSAAAARHLPGARHPPRAASERPDHRSRRRARSGTPRRGPADRAASVGARRHQPDHPGRERRDSGVPPGTTRPGRRGCTGRVQWRSRHNASPAERSAPRGACRAREGRDAVPVERAVRTRRAPLGIARSAHSRRSWPHQHGRLPRGSPRHAPDPRPQEHEERHADADGGDHGGMVAKRGLDGLGPWRSASAWRATAGVGPARPRGGAPAARAARCLPPSRPGCRSAAGVVVRAAGWVGEDAPRLVDAAHPFRGVGPAVQIGVVALREPAMGARRLGAAGAGRNPERGVRVEGRHHTEHEPQPADVTGLPAWATMSHPMDPIRVPSMTTPQEPIP